MSADYASALVSLAGMAAQALAHKKAIKQQKRDTTSDMQYDIGMEEAAARGYRPARYMQQAHDAAIHNSRLDRIPVDYGQALSGLGRSLAGGSGNDVSGGQDLAAQRAAAQGLPTPQSTDLLPNGLELPSSSGPMYPGGSSPSASGQVGAPGIDLRAPDWGSLKLPSELDDLEQD